MGITGPNFSTITPGFNFLTSRAPPLLIMAMKRMMKIVIMVDDDDDDFFECDWFECKNKTDGLVIKGFKIM
jgi:hypothetical protein